ncbi:MAG: AraC family transcriptional regulator [Alphaproteobacteria bacterium]
MSIIYPEIEIVERSEESIRFLEHGWPTDLCRWHAHEECELHLITATTGKAFVGDFIGEFGPGSFYLTGPNLPHNWVTQDTAKKDISGKDSDQSVNTRDRLIQFDGKGLAAIMQGFAEFRDLRPLLEMARSGVEFHDFDFELANAFFDDMREMKGINRIVRFFSFLDTLNAHQNKSALSVVKLTQAPNNQKHIKIGEAIDYITRNYASDLSVGQIAEMIGMTEASFARYFQSATGSRFTEFVNRLRIGQACVMLFETEERISSVCFDVGFQNLANFNRQFLKMKNMTPGEYRHAARSNLLPNLGKSNKPKVTTEKVLHS